MRVLLLEDDGGLAERVCRRLKARRLAVDQASSLEEARVLASENSYDCLVLDRVVPGGDALEFIDELRGRDSGVPVMIISGTHTRLADRIAAFEAGADDVMRKPLSADELACRVLALCRRTGRVRDPVVQISDLEVDFGRRKVARGGQPIELTAREFTILEMLGRRPGEVVSRTELWEHCWNEHDTPYSNSLDVQVSTLRKKLGKPILIRTRRGVGYSLEPSV